MDFFTFIYIIPLSSFLGSGWENVEKWWVGSNIKADGPQPQKSTSGGRIWRWREHRLSDTRYLRTGIPTLGLLLFMFVEPFVASDFGCWLTRVKSDVVFYCELFVALGCKVLSCFSANHGYIEQLKELYLGFMVLCLYSITITTITILPSSKWNYNP